MNDDIVYGWHFLQEDGVACGGYRPPAVGVWEPPIDNPIPCVRGYHGSPTVLKALTYARGPILGRCEYRGVVYDVCGDKWAAKERRCIARVDASAWLRFAACRFAEEAMLAAGVADATRDAGWYAAWAAARAAVWAAHEAWMEAAALDLDSAPTWEAKP